MAGQDGLGGAIAMNDDFATWYCYEESLMRIWKYFIYGRASGMESEIHTTFEAR